jgi:hypothetical protein
VSACLQVIKGTGKFACEDFTLTDKLPGKFSGDLAMIPVMASAPVVSKGKEGSDGSLESSKICTTDTWIKRSVSSVPLCSLQVALCFGEEELPHVLYTSDCIQSSIAGSGKDCQKGEAQVWAG